MEYYISTDNPNCGHLYRIVDFINKLRLDGESVKNVCLFQYQKDKKRLWIKGNIDPIMKYIIFNNKWPDISNEEILIKYNRAIRKHYNYNLDV